MTESDIFWNTTDTGWVKAAWTLFSAWSNGSCIFVHELSQVDAKVILNVRDFKKASLMRAIKKTYGIQILSLEERRFEPMKLEREFLVLFFTKKLLEPGPP